MKVGHVSTVTTPVNRNMPQDRVLLCLIMIIIIIIIIPVYRANPTRNSSFKRVIHPAYVDTTYTHKIYIHSQALMRTAKFDSKFCNN